MYLYKVLLLETKKNLKPKHLIYYSNKKDIEYLFELEDYINDLIRIEYVKVDNREYNFLKKHIF